jgi:hypothetical protein
MDEADGRQHVYDKYSSGQAKPVVGHRTDDLND